MLKKVIYNHTHQALFIDGKFSSLIMNYKIYSHTLPTYVQNVKDIYFVHNGVLYKAHDIQDVFWVDDVKKCELGLMKEVLDDKAIPYIPWKELRSVFNKMREMGKLPERTNIQIHTDNAVLIDMPGYDIIEGQYYVDSKTYEILTYQRGSFTYGLSSEPKFDDYPDLNDSSTCMNLMLSGAKVQHMKVLIDMFDEYTRHKKLPRGEYINVQLQA